MYCQRGKRIGVSGELWLRLQTLGLVPEGVHLSEGHIPQGATSLLCLRLDIAKAADELSVRSLERIIWIDAVLASDVDDAEEEVTQLGFGVFCRARGDGLAKLTKLLVDLRPDILGLLPVEAHSACLVLYAVGLDEGGQRGGDSREDGLIPALLLLLQFLPRYKTN